MTMITAGTEKTILKFLVDLNRPEAMANAIEVLQRTLDYDHAFGIVNEMQNKNFIKIVYCVSPDVINVQLTRVGQQWYLNNSET